MDISPDRALLEPLHRALVTRTRDAIVLSHSGDPLSGCVDLARTVRHSHFQFGTRGTYKTVNGTYKTVSAI